jgi:hypothetical protein
VHDPKTGPTGRTWQEARAIWGHAQPGGRVKTAMRCREPWFDCRPNAERDAYADRGQGGMPPPSRDTASPGGLCSDGQLHRSADAPISHVARRVQCGLPLHHLRRTHAMQAGNGHGNRAHRSAIAHDGARLIAGLPFAGVARPRPSCGRAPIAPKATQARPAQQFLRVCAFLRAPVPAARGSSVARRQAGGEIFNSKL